MDLSPPPPTIALNKQQTYSSQQLPVQHGVQLKAATAMVRLRLYSCLLKIPPNQYDGAFANIIRQLGKNELAI